MVIDFQSTNFRADQKLLEFIQTKLSKLDKFYNRITGATVYLKVNKSTDKINKIIEIKISLPESQLFVTEKSTSFEAATELALEALRHQMEKFKTKLQSAAGSR